MILPLRAACESGLTSSTTSFFRLVRVRVRVRFRVRVRVRLGLGLG